ncbi:Clp protease N-terminal domain-containing protein [Polymorphospora rubra]
MPKVNVYLPDALADRVREARLPISRICQAALTRALDGTDGMTRSADAETPLPEPIGLTPQPNHHVAAILRQSHDIAAGRGAATVEPVDILQAFLDEGESLVWNAVELLGFPAASIQAAIDDVLGDRAGSAGEPRPATPMLADGSRRVLSVAAAEAARHGSAVTTGSHLLLGLIADTGTAGEVLRNLGLTKVITPDVLSALYYGAAYGQLRLERDTDTTALRIMMLDVLDRLDRLQQQVAPPGGTRGLRAGANGNPRRRA